jgi:uncharacterized membrane protein (TIGR02234 family)
VTPARERLVALGCLAAGGGLTLVAATATWSQATVAPAGLPAVTVTLTGSELAPALPALGLLALAGVVGVLATRGVARRAAGALLALAGVGLVLTAGDVGRSGRSAAQGPLADRLGVSEVDPTSFTASAWWAVAVLAGLLVAVGGILTAVHGGRWSTMSRRYDAPAAPARAVTPADAWTALDHGVDPTLDAAPGPVDPGDLPQ